MDNYPKEYRTIKVIPLSSAMGAEVQNIDLSQKLSQQQIADVLDSLYRHGMIYFRNQNLSHEDMKRLTLMIGEPGRDAYTKGIPGYPFITKVLKRAEDKVDLVFGGGWHTDSPFLAEPPGVTLLYGVDIPPLGGDTYFSNSALAISSLSETMQRMLLPLRTVFSAEHVLALLHSKPSGLNVSSTSEDEAMNRDISHPLVRIHPVTGARALYIDETYTKGIEGMTEYESASLIRFLQRHVTQLHFTCRLRWEKNTFAMWDNRLVLHQAFNDYDGYGRLMYRSTVAGGFPRGVEN